MKKSVISLLVLVCYLLSGCSFFGERIREPVTLYYLCKNYQEDLCCVIAEEEREASGHVGDLPYLLALYLMGPAEDEHRSPLPAGTQIAASSENGHLLILLSNTGSVSETDFSLICACLTLTCLEITDAESVTVQIGEKEKTMTRSSLTLLDTTQETTQPEES